MLKFYSDSPGLAWDTEKGKWVRVDESNNPLESVDHISIAKEEADLAFYDGPYQVEHFMDHWLSKIGENDKTKNFKSNFTLFDEKLGGIETGEIVVISGQRKNGKTLFAESWIHSMAEKDMDLSALYLSYEVETKRLLEKYTNHPELKIYVPKSLMTANFEWLRERCKEAQIKHKSNVLMIDHLHFMVDMNIKQNFSLNIGAFMRRLKQEIALGLGYAVILIAHQGQGKDGQPATINNIRDSSFITQESDSTIIINRRKNFDPSDLQDLENKSMTKYMKYCQRVMERGEDKEIDDPYSMGLATVGIEVSRRTGCYEYKKTFQKVGDFLEEL